MPICNPHICLEGKESHRTQFGNPESERQKYALIQQGFFLDRKATLEQAMPLFDRSGAAFLPIVSEDKDSDTPMVLGVLYQLDALRAMNRALSDTAAEEHS